VTTSNRAVKEHLRAVVNVERQRTARFMLAGRAVALLAHLAATLPFVLLNRSPEWGAAMPLEVCYALFALATVAVVRLVPRLLLPSAFLIALVDIPAATAISMRAAPVDHPDLVMVTTVALALAMIVGSGLTLNYLAILVTEISACIFTAVLGWRLGTPLPQNLTAICTCVGCGVVTSYLVSRVRTLVEQSRRRDLGGKYIIGDRIGVGGMAEVFEATYSPPGGFEKRVAVKRVMPAYAHLEEVVALFRREAAVGAQLTHPNIVQMLDFGCDGASYFLAMELVDGTSLSRLIQLLRRTGGSLPLPAFVALAKMMFDALEYIHSRTDDGGVSLSLVHRDVNPPNILISRQGEAKLGDFGVARSARCEALTRTGTFRGKVRYAAPEQLARGTVDARSDLFALGVTLHEALTGRRLFDGDTEALLAVAVAQQPIPAVSVLRPGVHPIIDEIVGHLLERDLTKRCANATDVARRLAQLPPELYDLATGRRQLASLVERARATAAASIRSARPSGVHASDATTRNGVDVPLEPASVGAVG
jgi:serine/threonine protein kinase